MQDCVTVMYIGIDKKNVPLRPQNGHFVNA